MHQDFSGQNLSGTDFRKAQLQDARFEGVCCGKRNDP